MERERERGRRGNESRKEGERERWISDKYQIHLAGVNRDAAHVNKWPHLLKPDRHISATADIHARQSYGCQCLS